MRSVPSPSSAATLPPPIASACTPTRPLTCCGKSTRPPGASGAASNPPPLPIIPDTPETHIHTVPSRRTAPDTPLLALTPAAIATTSSSPITLAGRHPTSRVPTPSSPECPVPHDITCPSRVSARLCVPPTAMCVIPSRPGTRIGASELTTRRLPAGMASPPPSAPASRVPHAHTVPSSRSATACLFPAAISMMLVRPVTLTGVGEGFGYRPSSPFAPAGPLPS